MDALIGEGDLASTYRVSADGEIYALRVLTVRDQGFGERLRRASAAQQNVDHPNLLRVVDVVEADGCPGVVTEFVEGTDLEQWIASGPHGPNEVLKLFEQMVEGVRAAHAAGLLHRNLKPSKILVGRVGDGPPRVRIADFLLGKVRNPGSGSAAVTQLGTTFGTPQYMSPEQFRGAASVDERSDLFSLGCLLYEMATGLRAFDGDSLLDVYQAVAACEYRPVDAVRPGLPAWIGELVAALLVAEPEARVPSAEALLQRIRSLDARSLAARPAPAPSASPPPAPAQAPAPVVSQRPRAAPPPTPPTPAPPTLQSPRASRALPPVTPLPPDEDPDLIGEEFLRPRRPTALLVVAALLAGLAIGLGVVVAVAMLFAWYLGAI
ncbi:MAG: serine/threonine-protein kinase [Myxococcota bacterium]